MKIRSMTGAGLLAGVLGMLAMACGAAPQDGSESTGTSTEAVTTCFQTQMCMTGHHWSTTLCECVPSCVDTQMCKYGYHWDPETCACAANCVEVEECMNGQHWNSSVCHCVR